MRTGASEDNCACPAPAPRQPRRRRTAAAAAFAVAVLVPGVIPCASAGGAVVISPLRGTAAALPHTQISFLGAPAGTLHSVSAVGSVSGRHSGRLRSYASEPGSSFVPKRPFVPGERVTVRARWNPSAHRHRTLSDTFTIAQPGVVAQTQFPITPGTPADVQSFLAEPSLHPPRVTVHQAASAASAAGLVIAAPFQGPGQHGPMIFDSAGELVWFRPLSAGEDATVFGTQLYHGKNALTWWHGQTLALGYGLGEDVVTNANYRTVAVVKAGNGLQADEHELTVTPQGAAWVLAYSPVMSNLSSAGGPSSGLTLDGVIQKIDIHSGLVMWEWHSLGHVDVAESYSKVPGNPANPYDYFHINSLTPDSHGNLLISARNTWALYELSARSGKIAWRLGGKKSTFKLAPNAQFAFQHNALRVSADEISVFDDEGAPPVNPPSRGELVKLNLKAKTATLAGQFVRAPALNTPCCGNAQPLPGGNWMVGWGGLPNFTEFNAAGQMLFDAQFPAGEFSYRVYREAWSAQPAGYRPAIVARSVGSASAVYASWNGATTVSSWQLLTGSSRGHLKAVSTTPKSGFETTIPAPPAAFYEVRALSASGRVLASSKVISPTSA